MAAEIALEIDTKGKDRKPYRLNYSLSELRTLLSEMDINVEKYRANFKAALLSDRVIDEREAGALLQEYDELLLSVASAVLITTLLDESGFEPAQRAAELSVQKRSIRNGNGGRR